MWEDLIKPWNNTVVPRFGIQYLALEDKALAARFGYSYETSPVPDQSDTVSNYLDPSKHIISFGAGYSISKLWGGREWPLHYPISVDVFFQYQLMSERTQQKLPTTNQQGWRIEGYQYAMGVGITTGF